MIYRFLLPLALATSACGGAASQASDGAGHSAGQAPRSGQSAPDPAGNFDANGLQALRRNLLAGHATFDGVPVTELRSTGRCTAVIITGRGGTPVRWAALGNLAPRLVAGRMTFDIPAGGTIHVLAAPPGDVGDRIDMGLGLLDADCAGG